MKEAAKLKDKSIIPSFRRKATAPAAIMRAGSQLKNEQRVK